MFPERSGFKVCSYPPLKKCKKKKYNKQEPYLCPKCKKVWQPSHNYSYRPDTTRPEYLNGFPKFGCYKLVCNLCK